MTLLNPPSSDILVTVKNMTKTFNTGKGLHKRQVHALRNVSFELKKGRALALVGESGSGKSTVARLLTRMHLHNSGEVLYRGQDINEFNTHRELAQYRKNIQMIFQDPYGSLNPAHTIYHHLARPLFTHGHVKTKIQAIEKVNDLLRLVELDPEATASKYPHQLSGGQRQRVSIARTVAIGAEIILADEPTSMLDVSIRLDILKLLNKMKNEQDMTFLYITHDIATARYFAEEIAIMYQGQIVEWGNTSSVIDNPQHPYTQLLLSAVPNPHISFTEAAIEGSELLEQANTIREKSMAPIVETVEYNSQHFYAQHD
ncbi:ATP-binding cassette domain-containing protein [Motilimonas cestriensis]|uniref:ATP-binding cassette domain-containing protein n=1 Tax=Motilimonas cestriensis TaxID=2742685 RepID=A0ABS8W9C5_9GAMM|nr:ATP-binding cassette domain-containing protein [Motilimonas cestriensis]MCE2594855.1 ATP-binding cassette domain-containing protein [Motilimonas cestriensis]